MNYFFILIGAACIIGGLVGGKFTTADPISGGGYKDDKELPLWLGRLLFVGGGILFFILGLVGLSK